MRAKRYAEKVITEVVTQVAEQLYSVINVTETRSVVSRAIPMRPKEKSGGFERGV